MMDPTNPVCRTISTLLSRIGDKWTVLVVSTLAISRGADEPSRIDQILAVRPSVTGVAAMPRTRSWIGGVAEPVSESASGAPVV